MSVEVVRSRSVTGEEILALRATTGGVDTTAEQWEQCVAEALLVVLAREADALVGIGFVAGNARHAQLVDVSVDPRVQRQGVGARLGAELLDFVQERGIRYVGLTFDPSKPWLAEAYARQGFRRIDFAMWHQDSLESIGQGPAE